MSWVAERTGMWIASTGRTTVSANVSSVTGVSIGRWMRSTMRPSSKTLTSQSSGGRSAVKPSATSASSARSTSDSRMRKSTSCSLEWPPCAYTAKLPPSAKGISDCLSTAATFLRVCRRLSSPRSAIWFSRRS